MEKKSMKDVKRLATDATDGLSATVRAAGFVALLKLLYKQKIKPRTAILLIAAYSLNDRETNEQIYNAFKNGFKRVLEINEEPVKEEKCMGFDIN